MSINLPFLSEKPATFSHQKWFRWLLFVLLILGIFFHFFNVDKKLFWHDEAYTSMRAGGYTRIELDESLFQERLMPARDLQQFQQIKPGSTFQDTINSLILEDPQHPPLYFLMARFWMQLFGGSMLASRLLPVLISLISLPFIYYLALELFSSKLTAIIATIFLSLSPFDILFAQTARQYSLLTLTAIASSWFLLKALKSSDKKNWRFYTITCAIGFYTQPFFVLTVIGQAGFLAIYWLLDKIEIKKILLYIGSIIYSLILYVPWILVLLFNYQRALDTTDWARVRVSLLYLVKLWILSFTSLFVDRFFLPYSNLDFIGSDSFLTYLLRLPFLLLIIISIYTVCRQTKRSTWLFILTSIFVPFLLLVFADLILGGKRSAVTRYLIPCFPGVQLAVAYLTTQLLLYRKQVWRVIFSVLITMTIVSCTINALSNTSWSKDLSYHNAEVAQLINARSSPLIISDRGDDWTNLGDLLSLSYLFDNDVQLFLIYYPPRLEKIEKVLEKNRSEVFLFRPSSLLSATLKQAGYRIDLIFPSGRLWKLTKR